jgi:hypothetical protein
MRLRTKTTPTRLVEALESRRLLSFSPAVSYPAGYVLRDIATADFNNDGRLDLVMANAGYGANSVSVLLGNGNGTFQPGRVSNTGVYPIDVAVGDFNEDGKLDVATANDEVPGNEGVSVLLGLGDGTFAWTGDSPISFEWSSSIVSGDLNADGHVDLVATEVFADGDTCVSVMIGHGDATFTSFTYGSYSYDLYSKSLSPPALADVNGDGRMDVAVPGFIFLGNGSGGLQEPIAFNTDLWTAMADFKADGILDRAGYGGAGLSVSLGKGDGTFAPAVWTAAGNDPTSVTVGDFNGDGRPDAALANFTTVSVLLNDGNWATKTYIGANGGNWSTASNWSPAGVPTGSDFVSVAGKSVNLSTSATITALTLTGGAALTVSQNGGGRVLRTSGITIGAGSKLDLTDNDLIVDYAPGNVTTPGDVEAMVAAGFGTGNWQGMRITSSVAAAPSSNGNYALAVADNAKLTNKFGDGTGGKPTFAGQSVDETTVLVKFTHRVDLDLDGLVTPNDAITFATNYVPNASATWQFGDLDFDGKFTPNDGIIFSTFYNASLSEIQATSGSFAGNTASTTSTTPPATSSNMISRLIPTTTTPTPPTPPTRPAKPPKVVESSKFGDLKK